MRAWDAATKKDRAIFDPPPPHNGAPCRIAHAGDYADSSRPLCPPAIVSVGNATAVEQRAESVCTTPLRRLTPALADDRGHVRSRAFSPDGRHLGRSAVRPSWRPRRASCRRALPIPAKAALLLLDAATGEPFRTFRPAVKSSQGFWRVTSLALSPGGHLLAAGRDRQFHRHLRDRHGPTRQTAARAPQRGEQAPVHARRPETRLRQRDMTARRWMSRSRRWRSRRGGARSALGRSRQARSGNWPARPWRLGSRRMICSRWCERTYSPPASRTWTPRRWRNRGVGQRSIRRPRAPVLTVARPQALPALQEHFAKADRRSGGEAAGRASLASRGRRCRRSAAAAGAC